MIMRYAVDLYFPPLFVRRQKFHTVFCKFIILRRCLSEFSTDFQRHCDKQTARSNNISHLISETQKPYKIKGKNCILLSFRRVVESIKRVLVHAIFFLSFMRLPRASVLSVLHQSRSEHIDRLYATLLLQNITTGSRIFANTFFLRRPPSCFGYIEIYSG
jgi:hypothetical protein